PIDDWPQSLRTIVGTCLSSRFPILIWWGPELVMLYNDAYAPLIGAKHPRALGTRGQDVFPEIWHIIGPMLDGVLTRADATWSEDQLLLLERRGFPEECYFTFSYSPIRDALGGVGGVFTAVTETTDRVIGERRLAMLRALAERTATCRTIPDAVACTMASIEENPAGAPFAVFYEFDDARSVARLAAAVRADVDGPGAPSIVPLAADAAAQRPWPLERVVDASDLIVVDVPAALRVVPPLAQSDDVVRHAAILPVRRPGQDRASGALVVGLSPILPADEAYLGHLRLVAGHLTTAIANAEAYEAERRRAEELAAVDRAKTAFFSNVSHEFRTPLTLLLAPLEDAIADPLLVESHRASLTSAHRNALRLLKLVNTLLDFSRIEAGRALATYEPVDLGAFTADLASTFRSACERAGLVLRVELPDAPVIAHVDRGMWEKIVLNLVSNAFKHTFEGGITVRVGAQGADATLDVLDTGIGIPAEQRERIFERFHRVPNARSRSFEGTGIGLSLVQELVRLHGGRIDVESDGAHGSRFTVRLPLGATHLPPDRVVAPREDAAPSMAQAYLEEALRWIPETPGATTAGASAGSARVLCADDNADMREYVARLLHAEGWEVDVVPNGAAALEALRDRQYDLLISDVMMPGVDGHALVRAVRADRTTRAMPVILLSARAGEEARVDALASGTDDYLEKPFSARELVARVRAHLALAAVRARAAAEAERAREIAEDANRAKSAFLAAMSHELRTPLNAIAGYADLLDLEIHGPLTAAQRGHVTRLKQSEQHLLRLINDVLDFAKIEAGRVDFALEDVPLEDVIASVAPMIEPQLAAKQLVYRIQVPTEYAVRADRERLQQILLNLLSNSVKFTAPGGSISISAVPVDGTPDRIYLRVTDTGVGIPLALQERIFDPFVQGKRPPTGTAQGTGLGLAISRDLARGMGGDLRVRSEPGDGSTFTLTLLRARSGESA
ncbi:MAG TPA: ATP-binding protein, partial [Gemmatimonadaceae bacterium]|nr:ATP-binding protein [Gemmatimonadaceae bacterium]